MPDGGEEGARSGYRHRHQEGVRLDSQALGLPLAILYNKGLGVPQDYVQAYVWFDLAAIRFSAGQRHDQAAEMRDMMAAFLTPEQLSEAQRLSEDWQTKSE